jgi:hypothetical protein
VIQQVEIAEEADGAARYLDAHRHSHYTPAQRLTIRENRS